MIVVDANVLVYFWVGGPGAAMAESVLRKDAVWASPILWRSEFRNTLAGMVRAGHIARADAFSAMHAAEQEMLGREYRADSEDVLSLALESGCSAYDCEYASVARQLGLALVSFDRELVRGFPDVAIAPERFVVD